MDNKNNKSNSTCEVKKKKANQSDNSSQSTSNINNTKNNINNTKKSSKRRKKIICKSKCDKSLGGNNILDTNLNNKLDLQLYKFSYADFVILSSTLAFAISDNLKDPDLDILITFIGMVEADLALLRTRRGIIGGLSQAQGAANVGEEGVIEATEATETSESVASSLATQPLSRKSKSRGKVKKIKKKKVKKSDNNIEYHKSPDSN